MSNNTDSDINIKDCCCFTCYYKILFCCLFNEVNTEVKYYNEQHNINEEEDDDIINSVSTSHLDASQVDKTSSSSDSESKSSSSSSSSIDTLKMIDLTETIVQNNHRTEPLSFISINEKKSNTSKEDNINEEEEQEEKLDPETTSFSESEYGSCEEPFQNILSDRNSKGIIKIDQKYTHTVSSAINTYSSVITKEEILVLLSKYEDLIIRERDVHKKATFLSEYERFKRVHNISYDNCIQGRIDNLIKVARNIDKNATPKERINAFRRVLVMTENEKHRMHYLLEYEKFKKLLKEARDSKKKALFIRSS